MLLCRGAAEPRWRWPYPMNAYHSAEEHVCYGCEGPREIDQAGHSVTGFRSFRRNAASASPGVWRPQGDSNPHYRRERGFEAIHRVLQRLAGSRASQTNGAGCCEFCLGRPRHYLALCTGTLGLRRAGDPANL